MKKNGVLALLVITALFLLACGDKFSGTSWESKYDYKVYQDRIQGTDSIEFGSGSNATGVFANPGLPSSHYTFTYKVEGTTVTLLNPDLAPKIFTLKEGKLISEDGNKVFEKKQKQQK